jgi:gliding motility-associated-like protein
MFGQTNLVPNPSFEDTLNCPFLPGHIELAPPWTDPTNASSDLISECNNSLNGLVGVPNNIEGFQFAHSGAAYAGFGTYSQGTNYREYIQVKLNSQLKSGKNYLVTFYVSLADTQTVACNNLGLYFSDSPISGPLGSILSVTPQITNDPTSNPLTGKTNWTKISGVYTSNGNENYITIGNFLSDLSSDTTYVGGGGIGLDASYYYIDDVSIICSDCDTLSSIANVFTPNNDGSNDYWEVKHIPNIVRVEVYDRWGLKVAQREKPADHESVFSWDGRTTSGEPCSAGVYYYIISTKENNYRGFIQLIR